MKDEIKEILDKCTPFLFGDEVDKLTNHITNLQDTLKDREEYCYGLETQLTNLQEEVNKLTAESTEWESKCYDLQEENKRLSIELNKNMIERNNYLSRNEKAIEYIEMVKHFALIDKVNILSISTLENILNCVE